MDIQASSAATAQRVATYSASPPSGATAAKSPAAVATGADKDSPAPDLKQVNEAVDNINKAMRSMSRSIEFSVDTDSQRTIVKIVDQKTREVIRQMPTAEALEIGKALEKMQGLLIEQTA